MQKVQEQNQDHRRDIDAAEIGQEPPDRPQGRIGQLVQRAPDLINETVAGVNDVERDQPTHDRRNDHEPETVNLFAYRKCKWQIFH